MVEIALTRASQSVCDRDPTCFVVSERDHFRTAVATRRLKAASCVVCEVLVAPAGKCDLGQRVLPCAPLTEAVAVTDSRAVEVGGSGQVLVARVVGQCCCPPSWVCD